jgi:hypothetical protein
VDAATLASNSARSNEALRSLAPDAQWVHSYVVDDKIFCLFQATGEEIVREHGRCAGVPRRRRPRGAGHDRPLDRRSRVTS